MNTRTFALIFGVVFLIVGVCGFVPGMLMPPHYDIPPDADVTMRSFFGYELDLFPVNLLHNIVHILFGLWGLMAYRSYAGARTYFRAVAIIYALLAVMGLMPMPALYSTFGLIPIYGNDVWLHVLLALVALYFGWVNRDTAGDRV